MQRDKFHYLRCLLTLLYYLFGFYGYSNYVIPCRRTLLRNQSSLSRITNFSAFVEYDELFRLHEIAPPMPVLSQVNPIHLPTFDFSERPCRHVSSYAFYLESLGFKTSPLGAGRTDVFIVVFLYDSR
jgi:hypothetical protein